MNTFAKLACYLTMRFTRKKYQAKSHKGKGITSSLHGKRSHVIFYDGQSYIPLRLPSSSMVPTPLHQEFPVPPDFLHTFQCFNLIQFVWKIPTNTELLINMLCNRQNSSVCHIRRTCRTCLRKRWDGTTTFPSLSIGLSSIKKGKCQSGWLKTKTTQTKTVCRGGL